MITRLVVNNFRSLKHVEIKLGPMNALVGPNNAGKSNIMRALNVVLGDQWPTARSFDEKDFCRLSSGEPFMIAVHFDRPLQCDTDVHGFCLKYDGSNDCEFYPLDQNGGPCLWGGGKEKRVNTEMRDEVSLQFLSLDRQATQQLKPNKWTLYGKMLRHLESSLDEAKRESFHQGVEGVYEEHIKPAVLSLEQKLNEHVAAQTGLDLRLRMSVSDPQGVLANLRPYVEEDGNIVDAENVGSGVQSAIAVALARVYSEVVRKPLVLAIEEPELFLHPHGCRRFYSTLKGLSEAGTQVIYTTHERSFVNILDYESVHVVRKIGGATSVNSGIGHPLSKNPEMIHVTKFNEESNEVFFADLTILVEGIGDKIACVLCLEKQGLDLNLNNITIVECGGAGAVPAYAEVLNVFGISTFALMDEDPGNDKILKAIAKAKNIVGEENVLVVQPNLEGLFGFNKKPEKKDGFDMVSSFLRSNGLPDVFVRLKQKLDAELARIRSL